ncbi:HupE/UreJ family protein [Photobacterium profundum]|uniref:Urease accessory protein UreJ n=1 Tax=Photobacterium profundum 3TCK TaxID=314280 RepID=Q1YXE0_9GAMM|nr:HupE/UreJ family protein [Photobacterium profundum]EAS40908.1 urease accessory protein UreJ [Photobacterium profundum 3TCK]
MFKAAITRYSAKFSLALFALVSTPVSAHVGHGPDGVMATSFISGITHPLTGLDHLIMLLGLGFLVSQSKGINRQLRLITIAVFSMVVGVGLGVLSGIVIGVESIIMTSIFVVAFAVWQNKQQQQTNVLSKIFSYGPIALVVFHGWAHGLEAPASQLFSFVPGMMLSAAMLMSIGCVVGRFISAKWLSPALAISGVMLVLVG